MSKERLQHPRLRGSDILRLAGTGLGTVQLCFRANYGKTYIYHYQRTYTRDCEFQPFGCTHDGTCS